MVAWAHDFLLVYWEWISLSVIVAACLIFVSSLDDAFLDLTYWLGLLAPREPYPSTQAARRKKEQFAAIMIPAWQESAVIGAMLSRLAGTMDYRDYHVFVGTYPNDPDTAQAVREVARRFANVHCVVVKDPGPTSKADCLNQLIEAAFAFETGRSLRFGFFVLQDSEDVVHPFALKVMNWFADRYAMVQLPVLSLNRSWRNLIACHYMDEFAEWHGKDLVVRSRLTNSVPSAGVATAFSRDGLAMLRKGGGPIFNAASLTEDYEIAHRLHDLGGEAKFIRYFADMPCMRRSLFGNRQCAGTRKEIVSTRELFPHLFATAVRQKARWMLGISYLGWRNIGWYGDFWNRYFLMRDRKGMITAPTAMFGYLIVVEYLAAIGALWMFPDLGPLPPLVRYDWVWTLILINFFFLCSRLIQRAWFVGRTHGLGYVWLSPLRAVIGNFVAFFAFWRATRQFLGIRLAARPIKWDKTDHHYPDARVVRNGKPSVGDVLQHNGLITQEDIARAVQVMRETRRPLGLQLLDQGAIDEVSLAKAYAECEGYAYAGIDPLAVAPKSLNLLKPTEAARFCAIPWMRFADGRLIMALGEPLSSGERRALERRLRWRGIRSVFYVFAPLSDITFGVRHLYHPSQPLREARKLMAMMVREGYLTEETMTEIWRLIRRSYGRLGDVLMRADLVDHPLLMRALRKSWRRKQPLGTVLHASNQVPHRKLDEIIAQQEAWRPDPLGEAMKAGFLSPWMVERINAALTSSNLRQEEIVS